jgi:hypothetical protein
MASVQRTTAITLGGVISVHKTRVLSNLRSPAFPTNRAYLLLIMVSDSKAVSSGLAELGWLELQGRFERYSKEPGVGLRKDERLQAGLIA